MDNITVLIKKQSKEDRYKIIVQTTNKNNETVVGLDVSDTQLEDLREMLLDPNREKYYFRGEWHTIIRVKKNKHNVEIVIGSTYGTSVLTIPLSKLIEAVL